MFVIDHLVPKFFSSSLADVLGRESVLTFFKLHKTERNLGGPNKTLNDFNEDQTKPWELTSPLIGLLIHPLYQTVLDKWSLKNS